MNFEIKFDNPWLLLLLIPAFAIVLYTFFKVNRRFRYTANRIVSVVLCMIMVLSSVLMISGMRFSYDVKNKGNEVVMLVDYSYSNEANKTAKDTFVKNAIAKTPQDVKLGVVKFGYDEVCAVPMSDELDTAYAKYMSSKNPNGSATNISRALRYAGKMIDKDATGRVVVLTDGIETDGEAVRDISALSARGIKVDIVEFGNGAVQSEVMLSEVRLPNKTIKVNEVNKIEFTVNSNIKTDLFVKMYDNGVEMYSDYINISRGENIISLNHTFGEKGLHELKFVSESTQDTIDMNNTVYSYVNIEDIDKILILDKSGESESFGSILEDSYNVTCKDITKAPMNVDGLRAYDQIILMNIANRDMPEGFDKVLNEYVKEYGGSLLTVGGTREENGMVVPNMYDREDMQGTLYQDMLPVLAENYTPPVAVVLVLDVSGSMSSPLPGSTKTMMDEAKDSAKAALDALDDRDYIGVVVFGDTASVVLEPTPVANRQKIYTAIDRIEDRMQGTIYSNGLEKAGISLKSLSGVNKKHIILISDGAPSHMDTKYIEKTENNYAAGITTSVISYNKKVMALEQIAEIGHGNHYVAKINGSELANAMRQDLAMPEIREFEYSPFKPTIGVNSNVFEGINEEDIPSLDGFYGARLRKEARALLVGEYGQPIYADWKYGKGKVGSFMCDLDGYWSREFLNNANGKKILTNIVGDLFPIESIVKDEIELNVKKDNFEMKTNIYTSINKNEKIRYSVSKIDPVSRAKTLVTESILKNFGGNMTVPTDVLEAGIYEIKVDKLNKEGQVIASTTKYQELSYSKEYDPFVNYSDIKAGIDGMLRESEGKLITAPSEIFKDMVMTFHRVYDPRYILASLVILLLLSDLAVRKFKFKKIGEMMKDRKQSSNNEINIED